MIIEAKSYPAVTITATEAGAMAAASALQRCLDEINCQIDKRADDEGARAEVQSLLETRSEIHELWQAFDEPGAKRRAGRVRYTIPLAHRSIVGPRPTS